MSTGRCPGQDRRYWKPEDIFEEPCPECGGLIEFWKDDVTVRCPHCRNLVKNPRFDPGCAAWCSYASKCLGSLAQSYLNQPRIIRDRLEVEARKRLLHRKEALEVALKAASFAEKMAREEAVDPVVAIAACLLYDVEEPQKALAAVGLPADLEERITSILSSRDAEPQDPAWVVVQNARRLAHQALSGSGAEGAQGSRS